MMENYIVRIYRRANSSPDCITGIVEKPESGENILFRSNEEFINIFIASESTARPNNRQQVIEKRKYRRFNVTDSTLIFDATTDVGEIIDVSMGGLSFSCPNIPEDQNQLFKIGILCEGAKNFCTGKINCKNLKLSHSGLSSNGPRKRFSIEFDSLNAKQESQVEHILQNYSQCKV
jgi:hypothetical protein